MFRCPECDKEAFYSMRSNAIDSVKRCPECYDAKRAELGLAPIVGGGGESQLSGHVGSIKEFAPYKLENGPLCYVEGDKHFDNGSKDGRRGIHVQSKQHENAIMEKMGCNFGEKGQEVLGFKLGYDKPEKKVHIRR